MGERGCRRGFKQESELVRIVFTRTIVGSSPGLTHRYPFIQCWIVLERCQVPDPILGAGHPVVKKTGLLELASR